MVCIFIAIISGFSLGVSSCSLFISLRNSKNKLVTDMNTVRSDIKHIYTKIDHMNSYFSLKYR